VQRQQSEGYRLIYAAESKRVVAAAGYRFLEFLAWGQVLYVDDLITLPDKRGAGHGGALMDWLIAHGRKKNATSCISIPDISDRMRTGCT
jgi:GNAT superfamily N-acetyltransferase